MKIVIDRDRCESNMRCVEAAPTVFALDDEGIAYTLIEQPGADLRPQVAEAARRCPRLAITVIEDEQ